MNIREQIARERWQERYASPEHTSFEDDLPYVQEKCYDFADHILEDILKLTDKEIEALDGKRLKVAPNTKIICLCGSTRFIEIFAVLSWEFEKQGCICLGLHYLPASYTEAKDHLAEAQGVKEHFDDLHKRKIDLADEVFVINKNGYIGESTRSEINYALKIGKPVSYLETVSPKDEVAHD